VSETLSVVQTLNFELGSDCNLKHVHIKCPNMHPERYQRVDTRQQLTDDAIVGTASAAYRCYGFTGFVGWIFYNEPLLQEERMFRLMSRIRGKTPKSRFMLWTNGTLIPERCAEYERFETIIVSGYGEHSRRGYDRLVSAGIAALYMDATGLDDRLHNIAAANDRSRCVRPFLEMIVDNYGNTRLCCHDWQGRASYGNIMSHGLDKLAHRWHGMLEDICGTEMTETAPELCRSCGFRESQYQTHDPGIVRRAIAYRRSLS